MSNDINNNINISIKHSFIYKVVCQNEGPFIIWTSFS